MSNSVLSSWMVFPTSQVGTTQACIVVHFESENDVSLTYTTEPLLLIRGTTLEFTVSTEDTQLEFNSKYQMTIEGSRGSEKLNRSTVSLSKFLVLVTSLPQSCPCTITIYWLYVERGVHTQCGSVCIIRGSTLEGIQQRKM